MELSQSILVFIDSSVKLPMKNQSNTPINNTTIILKI